MELTSALRTTGAARLFTPEPIDDGTIAGILDDARFAPSGGNRQPWRVAVVADPGVRAELGALMRPVWDAYVTAGSRGVTPFVLGQQPDPPLTTGTPNALIDGITGIPVVLAVAVDLGRVAMMDGELGHRPAVTAGASIYPFCWSILLAARARGIGGVITTFAARVEPTSGPLLGLPPGHALAAVLFLGRVERFPTRLTRRPVEAFATRDRFDGPVFDGPAFDGPAFDGPVSGGSAAVSPR